MPRKPNRLMCADTIHDMTPAYLDGARAMRRRTPHGANPHPDGSQESADWNAGHTNEAALEHYRHGRDVISMAPLGLEIDDDPSLPRDKDGNIIPEGIPA